MNSGAFSSHQGLSCVIRSSRISLAMSASARQVAVPTGYYPQKHTNKQNSTTTTNKSEAASLNAIIVIIISNTK